MADPPPPSINIIEPYLSIKVTSDTFLIFLLIVVLIMYYLFLLLLLIYSRHPNNNF